MPRTVPPVVPTAVRRHDAPSYWSSAPLVEKYMTPRLSCAMAQVWLPPPWLNERFTAHITSPVKDALVGEVLAWTPSTAGVVRASAMQFAPPDHPTAEALAAFFDSVGDRVKDRIVLVGPPKVVGVTILPPAKRLDDNEAKARFDPVNPTPSPFANQAPVVTPTGQLTANQVNERVDDFLVAHHAAVRVNDGGRDHGQIRAFNNRTFDVARTVPTIILRNEDFGRIARLLAGGRTRGAATSTSSTTELPARAKPSYNAVGGDPWHRQGRRGGHAWRATSTRGTPRPAPPTTPSGRRS